MPPTEPDQSPPKLERPTFHVWVGDDPDDQEPDYVGVVTVTNADQLTAETHGRAQGMTNIKAQPFLMTNLWIWAAMVRRGLTSDKFPVFIKRMDYRPVNPNDQDPDAPDPTSGAPEPNTESG